MATATEVSAAPTAIRAESPLAASDARTTRESEMNMPSRPESEHVNGKSSEPMILVNGPVTSQPDRQGQNGKGATTPESVEDRLGPRPVESASVEPWRNNNDSHPGTPAHAFDDESSGPSEMAGSLSPVQGGAAYGTATPPERRSVHFGRPSLAGNAAIDRLSPLQNSVEETPEDGQLRDRKGVTLFSKLKSFAVPSGFHGRSQSGYTVGGDSFYDGATPEQLSPAGLRETGRTSRGLGELESGGNYVDPGVEDAAAQDRVPPYFRENRRRHGRRRSDEGPSTAPATPSRPTGFHRRDRERQSLAGDSIAEGDIHNPIQRRATITEIGDDRRTGRSEDVGRERLGQDSPRRPKMWHRGLSHGDVEARRPSNFRRLTTWAAGSENVPAGTPAQGPRWRTLESNLTMSASRWRALKAGLKMMGQRRKDEHKFDHAKSAELLAELAAGAPAAIIMASMFQRDDHGHKRIPVLLEQLKVKLTDSKRVDHRGAGDRHQVFCIELEYGSGLTRMKWLIHRSLRDFTNLHVRYKIQSSSEKYKHLAGRDEPSKPKLPRFPRTAFPFLRGVRGLGSDDEDDGDDLADDDDDDAASNANAGSVTGAGAGAGAAGRRTKPRKKRPSLGRTRQGSVVAARSDSYDANAGSQLDPNQATGIRREPYPERQRKKLEQYLQQLIRHLMFRPDSSRLCKFLEMSSLGIRLAAEGSYHGKEGFLVIQSAKGLDFRTAWRASFVASRHAPKWFLVRHSYVVCVDSPEEMNIYDVFLVDSDFDLQSQKARARDRKKSKKPKEMAINAKHKASRAQHHPLKLRNSERKLRLLAKNERHLAQFEESITFMLQNTIWSKPNRFGSFAPVRTDVFAQWLVDGRDYMWNVSRAISMARDVIYIHDWWLSPELYMRRPAAISRKWRLDRLLQRKATEGVKVFVILYRNINSAVPIDSTYTKFSLLDLHPNIFVQRSPNQFRQNTFFWAHHEKICVVDHTVAFVGGIDLCFGRWDTPQHSVCDDKLTGFEQSDMPKDADHCQLWPGKDYSNPRVQDFYALDKPYEEMYDRTNIPRMPWHDISMQIVGQPARDLTRHFVQRWNYVLRQRKPTRPTPFLLPPPDFNRAELETLGLDGTCEVQILRSSCWWSTGTPDRTEHSIMTAYAKMIQQSEHFVYIENQFFISSCEVDGTIVENVIGDALVERALRAAREGDDWRAVIVIPLMPGFQNTVDSQDGTSVRLIMQCQYRSICRGENSIWGKLRAQGVEPEDYVQFYGLRAWGKIGPSRMLVSEQLYIHAKCMVVDDRVAIIGSANINERSMLGDRDSECAAIVRDTDMVESSMNGKPYLVGRFPHTLRMRLMREHLGVDVDEVMEQEHAEELARLRDEGGHDDEASSRHGSEIDSPETATVDHETEEAIVASRHKDQDDLIAKSEEMFSFNHDVDWEQGGNPNILSDKRLTEDRRVTNKAEHREDVEGRGADHMLDEPSPAVDLGRDSAIVGGDREVLVLDVDPEGRGTLVSPRPRRASHESRREARDDDVSATKSTDASLPARTPTSSTLQVPARPKTNDAATATAAAAATTTTVEDVADVDGSPSAPKASPALVEAVNSLVADMRRPAVGKDCMKDPLSESFHDDIWHTVAENNAKLFRYVFRCMPDNEVTDWKKYKEYVAYGERFAQAQGGSKSKDRAQHEASGRSGPAGVASVPEKFATLAPLNQAISGVQQGLSKISDKMPGEKSPNLAMGRIADWAHEASEASVEKHDGVDANANTKGAVVNEKTALEQYSKPATGSRLTFATTNTTNDDEKAAMKDASGGDMSLDDGKSAGDPERLQRQTSPAQLSSRSGVASAGSTYPNPNSNPNPSPMTITTTTGGAITGGATVTSPTAVTSPITTTPTGTSFGAATTDALHKTSTSQKRRRRGTTRSSRRDFLASDDVMDKAEAEELMELVQGHLVVWPYDWLLKEEQGGNWLYSIDQLAPLEI
ncbi:MAG: Phospholipase D1 [Lichina confinis]|nr:MAG: Phospholipase D1 [Lichina confinis]